MLGTPEEALAHLNPANFSDEHWAPPPGLVAVRPRGAGVHGRRSRSATAGGPRRGGRGQRQLCRHGKREPVRSRALSLRERAAQRTAAGCSAQRTVPCRGAARMRRRLTRRLVRAAGAERWAPAAQNKCAFYVNLSCVYIAKVARRPRRSRARPNAACRRRAGPAGPSAAMRAPRAAHPCRLPARVAHADLPRSQAR